MIVVKVGGAAGIDLDAVTRDVAALWAEGERIVLVHGGGDETNRMAEALGLPPRFVTSPSGFTSRYTDRATLEVFAMVVAGRVNKGLVERLQMAGAPALGLSGLDGRLLEGRHKRSVRSVENGKTVMLHGDHTGTIERVDADLLHLLLGAGYLPVVAPLGASFEGVALNVDGDRAAAAIAVALVLLSNVPGLLRDFPDASSLVPHVAAADAERALDLAQGRMKKKVQGAAAAVAGGVGRVVLADGRVAGPVRRALAGHGTVVA